jgi:hypothetical protein
MKDQSENTRLISSHQAGFFQDAKQVAGDEI